MNFYRLLQRDIFLFFRLPSKAAANVIDFLLPSNYHPSFFEKFSFFLETDHKVTLYAETLQYQRLKKLDFL